MLASPPLASTDALPAPAPAAPAPPPTDADGPLLGLLAGLAREAMRHEPADLVVFARSYFTDLDAARAPALAPSSPPTPEAWSPAADAEAVTPASLAPAALAPPTNDDDVSGALAAILSVGSASRLGGSGLFDVSETLAAAAAGDT